MDKTEAMDICADLAATPAAQCPKCHKWQDDSDDFYVLKCEHCDYCSVVGAMKYGILDYEQWCPVHLCWENPDEWMACDDDLHKRGYRRVAGFVLPVLVMQAETGESEFELTI